MLFEIILKIPQYMHFIKLAKNCNETNPDIAEQNISNMFNLRNFY